MANSLIGKVYLGDGVYTQAITFPDGQYRVILETSNGVSTTNTIVLEPEVLAHLIAFIERLKNQSGK